MVIYLITTGKADSDHNSDQTVLPEAAKRLRTFYQFEDIPDFIYVGDAAMYSNILPLSEKMKCLTHVPETLSEAKDYLSQEWQWTPLTEGYSYHCH
jgi:transposase